MYIIFLVMYFLLLFVATIVSKRNKIELYNKSFLFFFIIIYCILIATRSTNVIPDMYSYEARYYGALTSITYNDIFMTGIFSKVTYYSMGVGASLVSYIFADLGFSFPVFSAFIDGIVIYSFLRLSIQLLKEFNFEINVVFLFFECIALYGLYYQFIAWAQGIAMLFVLFSFYFSIKKRIFLMLSMIIISMTFHLVGITAVLIIGIYWYMPVLKNNVYKILWLCTGVLVFSGFGYKVSSVVQDIVSKVVEIAINYNTLYSAYETVADSGKTSAVFIVLWIYVGIIIFEDKLSEVGYKLLNIVIIAQLMHVLFQSWTILHRITDILLVMMIFIGCEYTKRESSRLKIKVGKRLLVTGEEGICYVYVIVKFIALVNIFYAYAN